MHFRATEAFDRFSIAYVPRTAAPLNPCYEPATRRAAIMAREHPHHFVREAKRRERQAWAYLSLTVAMILIITIAFLWWTW